MVPCTASCRKLNSIKTGAWCQAGSFTSQQGSHHSSPLLFLSLPSSSCATLCASCNSYACPQWHHHNRSSGTVQNHQQPRHTWRASCLLCRVSCTPSHCQDFSPKPLMHLSQQPLAASSSARVPLFETPC